MVSGLPQAFYRITAGPQATGADFVSQAVHYIDDIRAGRRPRRPIPDDGEALHVWAGVSVFSSEQRAFAIMQRFPRIGTAIASLQVSPTAMNDGAIWLEKTGADPEHWTLWGDPLTLRACVQSR